MYSSDPRYAFSFRDYGGSISIADEFDQASDVPERDKILLQTFGLGYDAERRRVVVAYLRYLGRLSPDHQAIWNSRLISRNCKMAFAYYQNTIAGDWVEEGSIFEAWIEEQCVINDMCRLMGRSPIFRKTFREAERPNEFTLFLRPTRKNFYDFVQLLDKMLSENLDPSFFANEVAVEEEVELPGGRVEVKRRGTLSMLEEWLKGKVRLKDTSAFDDVLSPLREVRNLRQTPAHKIFEDEYYEGYFDQQIALMKRTYQALNTLRLMLALHPSTRGYRIPDWLKEGRIALY